jgi:hypothetical protein
LLLAFLLWIYLLPLAWVYGRAALRGLCISAAVAPGRDPGAGALTLVGFGVLSTLSATLGLFGPIGRLSHVLLTALGLFLAARDRAGLLDALRRGWRGWRATPWPLRGLAISLFVVVLWCSADSAHFSDTGLYHAQAIRWRQAFGVVPGLANLHPALVFTYPWFALSAFADPSAWGTARIHAHTGAVFLAFLGLALGRLHQWQQRRAVSSLVAVGCAAFGVHVFGPWLSSPTPDVAAAVSVWTAGILALSALERDGRLAPDAEGLAVALLCWYAVTFKLAYVPVALGPLILAFLWRRRPRAGASVLLAGVLVFGPFVTQTVIETGYLVHPFPALDLFAFDWKMPRPWVAEQLAWLHSWSRIPHVTPGVALRLPAREWIPVWWSAIPALYRALLAAAVLPLPFYAASWVRNPDLRRRGPQTAIVGLGSLGLVFWFSTAPDPRYALGFFVFQGLLLLVWAVLPALGRIGSRSMAVMWLIALAFQGPGLTLRSRLEGRDLLNRLLLPERDVVPRVRLVAARGFSAWQPLDSKLCWYESFPCAPQNIGKVEARGPTLASGFRALPLYR